MKTQYYNEADVTQCLETLLELKKPPVTGLNADDVLEQSKSIFLELFEAKVPVKVIIKHFYSHNINIPQHKISRYLASIRPKAKQKRKPTRKAKATKNIINAATNEQGE